MKLKNLDLNASSFTANGKEYFIEKETSIQRAVYAEAAKVELESNVRLGRYTEDWAKVYQLANETKFADIAVLAYNNQRAFNNFLEQPHPVLKLCACFINEKDEDRRGITDADVNRKIEDWQAEGITMNSFFALALGILNAETGNYASATTNILSRLKELKTQIMERELSIPTSE